MCNARPLYRVSYKMTEEIYREANRLLYRKRIPGICLIVFCFCIIALIPDISAGIMEGRDSLEIIVETVFLMLLMMGSVFVILLIAVKVFMKIAVKSSFRTYAGLYGLGHNASFYEDKVMYQSEKSHAEFGYDKFWRMLGNKEIVVMLTGSRWQPGMIILPKNGLWEKQDEQMEKFLRGKCINVKKGIEHCR